MAYESLKRERSGCDFVTIVLQLHWTCHVNAFERYGLLVLVVSKIQCCCVGNVSTCEYMCFYNAVWGLWIIGSQSNSGPWRWSINKKQPNGKINLALILTELVLDWTLDNLMPRPNPLMGKRSLVTVEVFFYGCAESAVLVFEQADVYMYILWPSSISLVCLEPSPLTQHNWECSQ